MLQLQEQVKKKTTKIETRVICLFDEFYEFNGTITFDASYIHKLKIDWEINKKKLWANGISKLKIDAKLTTYWNFKITNTVTVQNYYLNDKNVKTYYTPEGFLNNLIENMRNNLNK